MIRPAARVWIACLLAGASGGVLTLVLPPLGLLLVAAGALPAVVSDTRYAALGGLLTGLGATWLVLIGAANARCESFNSLPGQECVGPDLGPWLTIGGAMLAAGVLLSVGVLVRGRRS
ncbi:MAG: hypothetical protein H0U52_15110 [Chloroflexi bacterium]|nr:hypothetical protein [Chloroflexota bacterium]